jgi:ubiquinone/menaquinone biosynthesis C-methylase UbiE
VVKYWFQAFAFKCNSYRYTAADMNGVAAEYRYLRPSIERYPKGPELVEFAVAAGFSTATFYELAPGNLMGCLVMTK